MAKADIKICGLSSPSSVATALSGGATHIGFIFFAKSPRNVTPGQAAELARMVPAYANSVAVVVDAGDGFLDGIVETVRPSMLQLHGRETPARVAALKARYHLPVMKAFAIREAEDLEQIQDYREIADRFLLDAKPPAGSELPGGNGEAFDWTLLAGLDRNVDYMLSGGLNAGNIGEALAIATPAGVDISSGVESAPGVKDDRLIEQFLARMREINKTVVA